MSDGRIEQDGAYVAGSAEQPRVGEVLRAGRERRGESLADVADALKLTQRQVEAMEFGRFELLPGPAFVRGFVRNYARHVGLDGATVLAMLDRETAAPAIELSPVSNAEGTMPTGHGPRPSAHRPAAVILLLLVLAVAAGWYFDWFKKPDETSLTDVQPAPGAPVEVMPQAAVPQLEGDAAGSGAAPDLRMAPVPPTWEPPPAAGGSAASAPIVVVPPPATPAPVAPAEAPAAESTPPAAQGDQLLFRVDGESWIEVRDASGRSVFSSVVPAGSTRTVQGQPPFRVTVGNAPQVRIEYRGQPVDLGRTSRGVARITVQ